ncbi:MAG: hypothetical protein K6G55_00430 [Selenomonadaceae bacterium]|nr:hypothetical protein [Selenomonadaceae bacterium]
MKVFNEPKGSGIDINKREMRGTYTYDKESDTFKPCDKYPADKSWLNRAKKIAAEHSEFNTEVGTIGSQDTWNENIDLITFLREKYSVSCEEMETASAAQICKIADIPFIGIRTISNNITNGNSKYNPDTADTVQDFTLLLIDDYINDVN